MSFPSRDLNGNDCRKILKDLERELVTYDGYGYKLFPLFRQVGDYAVADKSDDEQIHDLCYLIKEIHSMVLTEYHLLVSSQKLHILIFHVPDFVKAHRSWGLYGEQPVERCHQRYNRSGNRLKGGDNVEYSTKCAIIGTSFHDESAEIRDRVIE